MKRYKFKATIEAAGAGGAYVIFPFNVEKEFGAKGKVPVKATFNRVPYVGTLMRYGSPSHMLVVLKAIREQIGNGPGDVVDVVLWKDDAERTLETPPDFAKRLTEVKLIATFEMLSYSHRREYCHWITEAKKDETRLNRIQKAVSILRESSKTPG